MSTPPKPPAPIATGAAAAAAASTAPAAPKAAAAVPAAAPKSADAGAQGAQGGNETKKRKRVSADETVAKAKSFSSGAQLMASLTSPDANNQEALKKLRETIERSDATLDDIIQLPATKSTLAKVDKLLSVSKRQAELVEEATGIIASLLQRVEIAKQEAALKKLKTDLAKV